MAGFSGKLRNILNSIIDRMAADPSPFARNPPADFSRRRKLDFANLIRLLLSMGGNSLNKELYDHYRRTDMETPTASAFVQQRAKLKPEALKCLFDRFNDACAGISQNPKTFKGYRLLAADSSTMTYGGYKSDDTYMANSNGWNQFQLHALYDVLNKIYADAFVEAKHGYNEPLAAWSMLERTFPGEKRLILCDRGYGGFNFIEHINRIPGAEYLIRIKDDLWKELWALPMANLDTTLTFNLRATLTQKDRKDIARGLARHIQRKRTRRGQTRDQWDFEPSLTLRVRIVRFQTGKDSWQTVATSLPKGEFPLSVIKELYRMRWGIETSFRELKYAIGVTNFHAKKRESVIQEIYARLVMYNFCQRLVMNVVIRQDCGRKWEYQVNFTMGIYLAREFYRCRGPDPPDVERDIGRHVLPVRPGRKDPRKVRAKAAVFFMYRVA